MNVYADMTIDRDGAEIEVRLSGRYVPEQKERGPSYDCGGNPGWPATVEDIAARHAGDLVYLTDSEETAARLLLLEAADDALDDGGNEGGE